MDGSSGLLSQRIHSRIEPLGLRGKPTDLLAHRAQTRHPATAGIGPHVEQPILFVASEMKRMRSHGRRLSCAD
jgi:hypothetical protein